MADPVEVAGVVVSAIAEDLDGGVDVTSTATIPAEARAVGDFIARGAGTVAAPVFADIAEKAMSYNELNRELVFNDEVGAGEVAHERPT